jgi:hypothetical protein
VNLKLLLPIIAGVLVLAGMFTGSALLLCLGAMTGTGLVAHQVGQAQGRHQALHGTPEKGKLPS